MRSSAAHEWKLQSNPIDLLGSPYRRSIDYLVLTSGSSRNLLAHRPPWTMTRHLRGRLSSRLLLQVRLHNHAHAGRTKVAFLSWLRHRLTFIQSSRTPTYSSSRKPSCWLGLRTSGIEALRTSPVRTVGGSPPHDLGTVP
ncbi:hypothetical protein CRG98_020121 [Punica granatum]|uniref:Uncharacterized protein n=1 Tax=Punica granatum TaxID=22663 RepID=A0A2I0JUB3_PUNGR|nr:hypothetical protein CRG98_020121 [Punica granatum]